MDKVCSTCVHCVKRHDGPWKSANYVCLHSAQAISQNQFCRYWKECTDSLEQTALDMLELIKAARMHPIVLDPNKMPGGQIVMPLPETVFADRLRAHGIEVPE